MFHPTGRVRGAGRQAGLAGQQTVVDELPCEAIPAPPCLLESMRTVVEVKLPSVDRSFHRAWEVHVKACSAPAPRAACGASGAPGAPRARAMPAPRPPAGPGRP